MPFQYPLAISKWINLLLVDKDFQKPFLFFFFQKRQRYIKLMLGLPKLWPSAPEDNNYGNLADENVDLQNTCVTQWVGPPPKGEFGSFEADISDSNSPINFFSVKLLLIKNCSTSSLLWMSNTYHSNLLILYFFWNFLHIVSAFSIFVFENTFKIFFVIEVLSFLIFYNLFFFEKNWDFSIIFSSIFLKNTKMPFFFFFLSSSILRPHPETLLPKILLKERSSTCRHGSAEKKNIEQKKCLFYFF